MTKPKIPQKLPEKKEPDILNHPFEEKFLRKQKDELDFDYNNRVKKFLTEEKIRYFIVEKKMPIRDAARLINIPEKNFSERVNLLGLGKKKLPINEENDDSFSLEKSNYDVNDPKNNLPEKITSMCKEVSPKIHRSELIALTILAYTKPGKKPAERIIKLLENDFAKNVAYEICKINNKASKEEIENANYIMNATEIVKKLNYN